MTMRSYSTAIIDFYRKELRKESLPIGLINQKRSCYINAVMQALTTCDELLLQMIVDNHYQTCEKAPKECLRCCSEHFLSILRFVKVDQCLEEETKTFINCVSKLCPLSFQRGRQEDSHELLINILNSLGEVESTIEPPDSSITIERAKHNKSESNKLSSIFTGQLCSSIRCLECQHLSNTREPFIDLELEINGCHSLSDALGAFCRVESLDGDNRYDCSHCARRTRAEKYLRLEEIPSLLCIQLKRFNFYGEDFYKDSNNIQFNMNQNLLPFTSQIIRGKLFNQSTNYELIAFVEHQGSEIDHGHYVAFVKRSRQWYCVDDSDVSLISDEAVLKRQPYILFYHRGQNFNPPEKSCLGDMYWVEESQSNLVDPDDCLIFTRAKAGQVVSSTKDCDVPVGECSFNVDDEVVLMCVKEHIYPHPELSQQKQFVSRADSSSNSLDTSCLSDNPKPMKSTANSYWQRIAEETPLNMSCKHLPDDVSQCPQSGPRVTEKSNQPNTEHKRQTEYAGHLNNKFATRDSFKRCSHINGIDSHKTNNESGVLRCGGNTRQFESHWPSTSFLTQKYDYATATRIDDQSAPISSARDKTLFQGNLAVEENNYQASVDPPRKVDNHHEQKSVLLSYWADNSDGINPDQSAPISSARDKTLFQGNLAVEENNYQASVDPPRKVDNHHEQKSVLLSYWADNSDGITSDQKQSLHVRERLSMPRPIGRMFKPLNGISTSVGRFRSYSPLPVLSIPQSPYQSDSNSTISAREDFHIHNDPICDLPLSHLYHSRTH